MEPQCICTTDLLVPNRREKFVSRCFGVTYKVPTPLQLANWPTANDPRDLALRELETNSETRLVKLPAINHVAPFSQQMIWRGTTLGQHDLLVPPGNPQLDHSTSLARPPLLGDTDTGRHLVPLQ